MKRFPARHCISRAELFLGKAQSCPVAERDDFEAFLEASIVFARAALHRLKTAANGSSGFAEWFSSIASRESVQFFKAHRDLILKESSPPIGQLVYVGDGRNDLGARHLYYFEEPGIPASDTVARHLADLSGLVHVAEQQFLGSRES